MKKINEPNYKTGRFCILNSREEFTEDEYENYILENCDLGLDEPSFDRWCEWMNQINVEDDLANIKYFKDYDIDVIVEGELGLWCGNADIEPTRFNSVYEALMECISSNSPYNDFDAYWDNGRIYVNQYHHDGTNNFCIRLEDKRRKLPYLYA